MNSNAENPGSMVSPTSPSPSSPFSPTRWTLVLRAQGATPEAKAALGELCEAYYQPVLNFLQREGREADWARDRAQEFFARLLARDSMAGADPERGRFRSYLLGALKHFLADQRKHEARQKRGGGQADVSLDERAIGGESVEYVDTSLVSPDVAFDREWALAVIGRALEVLRGEFVRAGRETQFDVLKPWLMGDTASFSQADAARRLEITEGAVKVMIHRFRKRFRDAVCAEIGQTLRCPTFVDEELRHLIAALS